MYVSVLSTNETFSIAFSYYPSKSKDSYRFV
jgi:hypothetical protein